MFVDASAIIAIIAQETDAAALAARLGQAVRAYTSPIAVYEAVLGLARVGRMSNREAEAILDRFLEQSMIRILTITPEIGRGALSAFERYGRGRHPARLNMGDCFAYACACDLDAPLLFKGDDFPKPTLQSRDNVTVFFTSDTHFGHAGALSLYRRPFTSVAAMNAAMVARWNETVAAEDEVWHLGDFSLRQPPDVVADTLARLNGRKHLVAGNNDPPATIGLDLWASVQPYAEIAVEGVFLVLCHYPFRSWHGMAKGAVDLHGHSHGRMKPLPRQFDVGVDVWNFRPVRLGELLGSRRKIVENRRAAQAT